MSHVYTRNTEREGSFGLDDGWILDELMRNASCRDDNAEEKQYVRRQLFRRRNGARRHKMISRALDWSDFLLPSSETIARAQRITPGLLEVSLLCASHRLDRLARHVHLLLRSPVECRLLTERRAIRCC